MTQLVTLFEETSRNINFILTKKPSARDMLLLYGLYKQATQGNCRGEEPGMLDMVVAEKYRAWKSLNGISPARAMQKYLDKVQELKENQ
jgi:acyl-CoA-binding protein